jgi:hypothetical protein
MSGVTQTDAAAHGPVDTAPAPGAVATRRKGAWVAPVAVGLLALGGCAYVATHDPYDPNQPMPHCPFKALTGLDCPLCGGLRMVRSLLTVHWSDALHANALLLVAVPFVAYAWVRWLVASLTGRPYRVNVSRRTWVVVLVVAVVWTVVRNLPGFPLQPVP